MSKCKLTIYLFLCDSTNVNTLCNFINVIIIGMLSCVLVYKNNLHYVMCMYKNYLTYLKF